MQKGKLSTKKLLMETNDKSLSIVIITKQDKQARFTINGHLYAGIRDILPLANANLTNLVNLKFDIYQDKYRNYILRRCERYPCFDSHDYAHENRFFRRYLICKSMEEAIEKYNYIEEHNESFNLSTHNSPLLAPLIYADDDRPEIEILTCSETEVTIASEETDWVAVHENIESNSLVKMTHHKWIDFKSFISNYLGFKSGQHKEIKNY